jgi:hypothetical protein
MSEGNKVFYAAAILPPGNVSRQIVDIQKELYYSYGKTSGLALPPLIPIAFSKQEPSDMLFSKQLTTDDPVTHTTQWAEKDNAWYIRTSNDKTWKKMQHIFEGDTGPQLVPPFPGLFIHLDEEEGSVPVSPDKLPAVPSLRWKTSRIAVLCIETRTYPQWWKHVFVTIKREAKLKMR